MSESAPMTKIVEVPGWAPPKGYVNGIVTTKPTLFVAGQIGWNARQEFEHEDFLGQFGQALDNVLAVVRAAGGAPSSVVKMTVYVTDLAAYRAAMPSLGFVWRSRFGRHFPAMALVGVSGLVEPKALVEIETIAALDAIL